jgi:hypothetical protein
MTYKLRIAMIATEEQYNDDLKPSLIQMGKQDNTWGDWKDDNYLTSRFDENIGNYCKFIIKDDSLILEDYNPELFLALAAMTTKEDGNIGEWWKFRGDGVYCGDSFTYGELYKQIKLTVDTPGAFEDNNGSGNGFYTTNSSNQECFVKATQEEIIEKFKNKKEIKMKSRFITPQNATRIIEIACSSWKAKLAKKWSVNIVLNSNIEVSEEFYIEMRKACTTDQHKVFDEIFGSDEQLINITDLEIGESMVVCEPTNSRWCGIIITRIWSDKNIEEYHFVDINNPRSTWIGNPTFKGKKVKLTITHEEIK